MAVVLGVTDGGRMRKIYKQSERAELVAAVQRGEAVPTAARRLGVRTSTAYGWTRRSRRSLTAPPATSPTFIEVVAAGAPSAVVVRVGTAEIEVRAGFDAGLLRAVVAALDGAAS
jgi:transposase-like protein